jgi:hypothetical protein
MGLEIRVLLELPYQHMRMIKRVEHIGQFKVIKTGAGSHDVDVEQVCSLAYMKNACLGNRSLFVEKFCYKSIWPLFKFLRLKTLYWKLMYGDSGLERRDLKLYGQFRKRLARASSSVIPTVKYVYVPLHLQPEMTTCALGGKYDNQALLLEELRGWLPDDIWIFVKENPKQGKRFPPAASRLYRNKDFFQRISKLKNVCFVPQNFSTIELIQSSEFVATVTGTAGFEALLRGKNCLVFGLAWFRKFSGVCEWSSKPELHKLLEGVDRQSLEYDCRQYLNTSINTGRATVDEISDWYTNQLLCSLPYLSA